MAATLAAMLACPTCAQALAPVRPEGCREAVLASYEHYDITAARGGDGGALDWVGCAPWSAIYTAGIGSYAVADSRWSIARGGISVHPRDFLWLGAELAAGHGSAAAGGFGYFTSRATLTVRAHAALFARLEHQYIDIGAARGTVVKLAAIAQPIVPLLVEAGIERSAGGNLGTRSHHARVDWVHSPARLFAGVVHGRTTPQAVDILAAERPLDARSREGFAGVAFTIGQGELAFSLDELRGDATRRRTLAASLRWALP